MPNHIKILLSSYALAGFLFVLLSLGQIVKPGLSFASSTSQVVINEISWMGSVENSNAEWVELKNISDIEIDVTGWVLRAQDGTPSTTLRGKILPDSYYLLERTSDQTLASITADQIYVGALSNSDEILELLNLSNEVIDVVVASTTWPAGDNQTKKTMERGVNGAWHTSEQPGGTPKAENSLPTATTTTDNPVIETGVASTTISTTSEQTNVTSVTNSQTVYKTEQEIVISEILPNPEGSDLEREYIELHNEGDKSVDLAGWKLVSGERSYVFIATTSQSSLMAGKAYLVLRRSLTKLVLPNDKGQVLLYSPESSAPKQVLSYEKASDGKAFAKNEAGEWRWSEQPTPGQANLILSDNQAPEVDWSARTPLQVGEEVLFDSSDTIDREDDFLKFLWQFGDGSTSSEPSPRYKYLKAGKFKAVLTVTDGRKHSSKEKTMTVIENKIASSTIVLKPITSTSSPIVINEFLPNPEGEDADGEWIELFNRGKEAVDLEYWQIDDIVGGSQPYQIKEKVTIKPLGYYLVNREDSNIALNNSSDEVRLFNNFGSIVERVAYSESKEGRSYARKNNGTWTWVDKPTPGKANIFFTTEAKSGSKALAKPIVKKTVTPKKTAGSASVAKTNVPIWVKGVVTALPGQVAQQTFYIVGQGNWQVYNYRKDFPKLTLGDVVNVYGTVQSVKGERRLKTRKLDDMRVLTRGQLHKPVELKCAEVTLKSLSSLATVGGELTKKTSLVWFIDDGGGEVALSVTKLISEKFSQLALGEKIKATGIVTPTANGVELTLRTADDVILDKEEKQLPSVSLPTSIPARNQAVEVREYLYLIGLGAIILLFGWFVKKRFLA